MKTRRELFSASTVLGSLLLVLSMTTGAQAQTLYRCGNSYQDKPCDKGQKEQILGKLATTDNTNKPVVDASCRLRGEDAKKLSGCVKPVRRKSVFCLKLAPKSARN
jgi:hypothetical protein